MTKHNAKDLIDQLKSFDKFDNNEIVMKAGRLYEALQDEEEPDNFEFELQVEIENLNSEENNTVQKQSELLADIMLKIKKP